MVLVVIIIIIKSNKYDIVLQSPHHNLKLNMCQLIRQEHNVIIDICIYEKA